MSATLNDIALDTDGYEVYSTTDFDRSWFDPQRDPVRVRLFDRPCPETTLAGWRERANAETAAGGGAVVSFEETTVDGLPGFRAVFKYPAARCMPGMPPTNLSVYIVGMIVVPLGERYLQINTEALESGDTGSREAIYGLKHPPTKKLPPTLARSMDDVFDGFRATLGTVLPSDAEEFDELAPWHPLSRVRNRQRQIIGSIQIGAALRAGVDRAE